jgi:hypothetical protein
MEESGPNGQPDIQGGTEITQQEGEVGEWPLGPS